MSETPYQQMARQFLDLWQKQLSAVMTDRDFIQSMLSVAQNMQQSTASWAGGAYEGTPPTGGATVSPGVEPDRIAELEYRIRMLEARIERLESAKSRPGAKRSGATVKRPAKRSARKG